jgi:hypothetical protein
MPARFARRFAKAAHHLVGAGIALGQGFRLISRRPVFSVALPPSTPMKDDRLFHRRVLAAPPRPGLLALGHGAANEVAWDASVMPWITPGVLHREEALGHPT